MNAPQDVGQKISISGGGRCNFTNLRVEPRNYLSDNPHFCKSALSRFTPLDFIKLIEKHGIAYHEKAPGQLFCDDRARRIVDLLLAECKAGGVTLKTGCAVRRIEKKDAFSVQTDSATYTAPALVVATGGLSYPETGATGFGYEIAEQFGLAVIACKPALVPLTYQPADAQALREPIRHFHHRGGRNRQHRVHGCNSVYAQRAERPRHPAALQLLDARVSRSRSTCCRTCA